VRSLTLHLAAGWVFLTLCRGPGPGAPSCATAGGAAVPAAAAARSGAGAGVPLLRPLRLPRLRAAHGVRGIQFRAAQAGSGGGATVSAGRRGGRAAAAAAAAASRGSGSSRIRRRRMIAQLTSCSSSKHKCRFFDHDMISDLRELGSRQKQPLGKNLPSVGWAAGGWRQRRVVHCWACYAPLALSSGSIRTCARHCCIFKTAHGAAGCGLAARSGNRGPLAVGPAAAPELSPAARSTS
jgi:hypothetical protein